MNNSLEIEGYSNVPFNFHFHLSSGGFENLALINSIINNR